MNLNELIWIPLATAVFGGVVTFLFKKISSNEYNKVRIDKTFETKQIKINTNVKEYISLYFKDERIEDLFLTEYEIMNFGNKHISPFELKFEVSADPNLTFVDMQAMAPEAGEVTIIKESDSVFILRRKFLSQYKKNQKEIIDVSIYSNKPLKITIIGGDKDWTIKVNNLTNSERLKVIWVTGLISLVIIAISILIYSVHSNSGDPICNIFGLMAIMLYLVILLILKLEIYLQRRRKFKVK